MAGKKYYAVLKGLKTGIFETWDECKESVDGYPGAQYKSFKTLAEAQGYLGGEAVAVTTKAEKSAGPTDESRPDALVAYVDGSYEHSVQTYGFGCVFILPVRIRNLRHSVMLRERCWEPCLPCSLL